MVTQLQIVICECATPDNTMISVYVILLFLASLKLSTFSPFLSETNTVTLSNLWILLSINTKLLAKNRRKKLLHSFSSSVCLQVISERREGRGSLLKTRRRKRWRDTFTHSLTRKTHKTVNDTWEWDSPVTSLQVSLFPCGDIENAGDWMTEDVSLTWNIISMKIP